MPATKGRLRRKQVVLEGAQEPHHLRDRHGAVAFEDGANLLADEADSQAHVFEPVVCRASVNACTAANDFKLIAEVVEHMQTLPCEQPCEGPGIAQGKTLLVAQCRRG